MVFVDTTATAYCENLAFVPPSRYHAIVVVFVNVVQLRAVAGKARALGLSEAIDGGTIVCRCVDRRRFRGACFSIGCC